MEWTIVLNEENQYVEVVTSGVADRDGSLNMVKAISLTMPENKMKKILIDHTGISSVSGKIIEIYNRPDEFNEIGVIRNVMVAEVVKPEHKKFFNFLETVFVNRGFIFSIFENRKSALKWLLKL